MNHLCHRTSLFVTLLLDGIYVSFEKEPDLLGSLLPFVGLCDGMNYSCLMTYLNVTLLVHLFHDSFICVQGSVLQCGAVCCSVLQCVAVCCSVLQCVICVQGAEDP